MLSERSTVGSNHRLLARGVVIACCRQLQIGGSAKLGRARGRTETSLRAWLNVTSEMEVRNVADW